MTSANTPLETDSELKEILYCLLAAKPFKPFMFFATDDDYYDVKNVDELKLLINWALVLKPGKPRRWIRLSNVREIVEIVITD